MAFTKKDVYMQAAKIYVSSFDPEAAISLAIPAVSQSSPNHDTIVTYLENNRTFARAGYWRDVSITHDVSGEKKTLEVDDCDVGIFANITTMLPKLDGEWVTSDDLETMSTFTGLTVLDVAGVLVAGATQTKASGAWGYNDPFVIANQNGDLSQLTINSVTGGTDGLLVANTDYFVGTNAAGETIITIIDSATVTTEAQAMVVDYDYTPNTSKYLGYDIDPIDIPFVIIKVIGCPDSDGEYNTYYIVKASLDGEIKETFVNLSRVDDVVGSSISFVGDNGGLFIEKKEKL